MYRSVFNQLNCQVTQGILIEHFGLGSVCEGYMVQCHAQSSCFFFSCLFRLRVSFVLFKWTFALLLYVIAKENEYLHAAN